MSFLHAEGFTRTCRCLRQRHLPCGLLGDFVTINPEVLCNLLVQIIAKNLLILTVLIWLAKTSVICSCCQRLIKQYANVKFVASLYNMGGPKTRVNQVLERVDSVLLQKKRSVPQQKAMLQETFDAAVKENQEEFGMEVIAFADAASADNSISRHDYIPSTLCCFCAASRSNAECNGGVQAPGEFCCVCSVC